jgi:TolB-like protein/DNA-binding response OmpR family regulator/Tfp pilus assembly protein PilF
MRSRIMVIGRDVAMRARLARLAGQAGHRAEVAESLVHARRAGFDGVALAIVDPDGLAADQATVTQELRGAVGALLIVARAGQERLSQDAVDIADETRLLARISEAVPSQTEGEATDRVLEFVGYRLDLAGHSLTDSVGKDIVLTPGEFGLLKALAEHAGRVLSRDRLLQLISGREAEAYDRSVDMQIMRLRRKIELDPDQPTLIVTVPGAGYKFAVSVQEVRPQKQARSVSAGAAEMSSSTAAAAKFAPPRLSIMVLPFANIGGDPEQEHFVDGVTESLTADLSRIRDSFVIGRHTAFAYRGKAIDVKQMGRELNVRYVLEGSLQRAIDRVRVSVQLLDTATGAYLWAERFDKPLAGLFDMQDQIVAHLANALDARLVEAEARRADRSSNPDSAELCFQGRAWLYKGLNPDNIAEAQGFFVRALAADPNNVDALSSSALTNIVAGAGGYVRDLQAAYTAAEPKLAKALALAPDYARAHLGLGILQILTKRAVEGIAECERALELDRNLAQAHAFIGLGKVYIGRAEETEAHSIQALRFSPRDTYAYLWMHIAGAAKLYLGANEQAIAWFRQSLGRNRNFPPAHFNLAAALAHLNRLDEARSSITAGLTLNPKFNLTFARTVVVQVSDDPIYLRYSDRFLEGLQRAGLSKQ